MEGPKAHTEDPVRCQEILLLCQQIEALVHNAVPSFTRLFILTDTNTYQHCLPLVLSKCKGLKEAVILEMKAGEENKDIYSCVGLWRQLGAGGADRQSLLINLGGGVVTDLGGFVASTFKRGIRFVNVPTSLLAMVDASSGGKTGVDLDGLKNEVGLFSFPLQTLIYPGFLNTLPPRHLRSGFAEAIKHALIGDEDLWQIINQEFHYLEDTSKKGEAFRNILIERSIAIKSRIVSEDPEEEGLRKVLNFGHTIGHAIESWSLSHDIPLLHGEAIVMGMLAASWLSCQITGLERSVLEKLIELIKAVYPHKPPAAEAHTKLLELMQHDKKNRSGALLFTLLQTEGKPVFNVEVDPDLVRQSLEYLLEVYPWGTQQRNV